MNFSNIYKSLKILKMIGLIGSLASILGFWFVCFDDKPSIPLQLTVFVTDNFIDVVLENEGELNIALGNRSLNEIIGANGRTNFPDITDNNIGDTIEIGLKADGWELLEDKKKYVFNGDPIHLKVKRNNSLGIIKGVVLNESGQKFIEGALVQIGSDTSVSTNNSGVFKIILPEYMRVKKPTDRYVLFVSKEGYNTTKEYYTPNTSNAEIRLKNIKR